MTRGVFITGTDTSVGKTVLASAICAALTSAGTRVAPFKPVVTGVEAEPAPDAPAPDHVLLAACAGTSAADVSPFVFEPPVSPHLAAELAGVQLRPGDVLGAAYAAGARADVLVCEGVGGLLVPITRSFSVRDLAVSLGLPVVIAARPGLGTINHSLLTVEAARSAGLDVRAIVLTPWPVDPSGPQLSNRRTIAELSGLEVWTLAEAALNPAALADAAADLPIADWLGPLPPAGQTC